MEQTITVQTNNQLFVDTDTSKVFVGKKVTQNFPFTEANATYDDVIHKSGTVFGEVNATGKVIPSKSDASDGSQYPIGLLLEDLVVSAGTTKDGNIALVVCGDADEALLVFEKSGDDLETIVDGRTYRARIAADTVGIVLKPVTDVTAFDNQ